MAKQEAKDKKVSAKQINEARDAKIVAAYKDGAEVGDLASKFGLSNVRIYRIMAAQSVPLRKRAPAAKSAAKPAKKKVAKKATKKAAKKATPRKATKAKPKGSKTSASAGKGLAFPKSEQTARSNKPKASDA